MWRSSHVLQDCRICLWTQVWSEVFFFLFLFTNAHRTGEQEINICGLKYANLYLAGHRPLTVSPNALCSHLMNLSVKIASDWIMHSSCHAESVDFSLLWIFLCITDTVLGQQGGILKENTISVFFMLQSKLFDALHLVFSWNLLSDIVCAHHTSLKATRLFFSCFYISTAKFHKWEPEQGKGSTPVLLDPTAVIGESSATGAVHSWVWSVMDEN